MSLLKDKKILLTGVLSNRSIAYGIAIVKVLSSLSLTRMKDSWIASQVLPKNLTAKSSFRWTLPMTLRFLLLPKP